MSNSADGRTDWRLVPWDAPMASLDVTLHRDDACDVLRNLWFERRVNAASALRECFPAGRPGWLTDPALLAVFEAHLRTGDLKLVGTARPVLGWSHEPTVDPDLGDRTGPPASEAPSTWLELQLVDEVGVAISGVTVSITPGGPVPTDGSGVAHADTPQRAGGGSEVASLDEVRDILRSRWDAIRPEPWLTDLPRHTFIPLVGDPSTSTFLSPERRTTLVFQPWVVRAQLEGLVFDTNKAFLLPEAVHRQGGGASPIDRLRGWFDEYPDTVALVVGHTDPSGDAGYNDPLSLERAKALKAYLERDSAHWLAFYQHPAFEKRWGWHEDVLMLEAVCDRLHLDVSGSNKTRAFQEHAGVEVDGIVGPVTRRALVEAYMDLQPASAQPSELVAHGCGENFLKLEKIDVGGVEGEVVDADYEDQRRVEVFLFAEQMGIQPPPPGSNSGPGSPEYPEWTRRARRTLDLRRDRQGVVRPLLGQRTVPLPEVEAQPGPEALDTPDDSLSFVRTSHSSSTLAFQSFDDASPDPTVFGLDEGFVIVRAGPLKAPRQMFWLRTDRPFDGEGTFTVEPPDKLRFFKRGGGPESLKFDGDHVFTGEELSPEEGVLLFAEGIEASENEGDIRATLTLSGGTQDVGDPATLEVTSVRLRLEVAPPSPMDVPATPEREDEPKPLPFEEKFAVGASIEARPAEGRVARGILIVHPPEPRDLSRPLWLHTLSGKVETFAEPHGRPFEEDTEAPLPAVVEISGASIPDEGKRFFIEGRFVSGTAEVAYHLGIPTLNEQMHTLLADSVAFTVGPAQPRPRLRLSVFTFSPLFAKSLTAFESVHGKSIPIACDLDPKSLDDFARAKIDDYSLVHTIFYVNHDATTFEAAKPDWSKLDVLGQDDGALRRPGGPVDERLRIGYLRQLTDALHQRGRQVVAGYEAVIGGTGTSGVTNNFMSWLAGAPEAKVRAHAADIVDFFRSRQIPIDGIGFDIELSGLGMQHQANLKTLFSETAKQMKTFRPGGFVNYFTGPFQPTDGQGTSPNLLPLTYSLADQDDNLIARPMCFNGTVTSRAIIAETIGVAAGVVGTQKLQCGIDVKRTSTDEVGDMCARLFRPTRTGMAMGGVPARGRALEAFFRRAAHWEMLLNPPTVLYPNNSGEPLQAPLG